MPTTIFPFDNANNYTFNNTKLGVTGGSGTLILEDNTAQTFTETFASSTGFTFDAAKTEFSGGQVQQLDATPAGSTAHSEFTTKDLNWGDGTLTGTLVGSASIIGGELDIPAGQNNYVQYDAANNVPSGNTGTVRIRFRAGYNSPPSSAQYLYTSADGENDINNFIRIMQTGNLIRWDIYNSTGTSIKTVQTGNGFTVVSGTIYEVELNFDTTAGEYRLFIDGTNVNGLQTSAPGTRNQTGGIIRVGKNYTSANDNVSAMDVLEVTLFDTVQHTANYTPGALNQDTRYEADTITLPSFAYTGLGAIQSFDSSTITETASPRYIINDEYYNGSAWVASDGSFAQANTAADFNTNLPTATVTDNPVIKIATDNTNTQMATDNLVLTYTGQIFPTDDPLMSTVQTIEIDEVTAFTSILTETGSDEVRFIANIDGVDLYHNGAAWVPSDGSFAQSNTQAEITALLPIQTTDFKKRTLRPKVLFHSDDGSTTPTIEDLTITYGFFNPPSDTISLNIVYGHNFNTSGDPDTRSFTVELNKDFVEYKTESIIRKERKVVTPDSDGLWILPLVETTNMEGDVYYIFKLPDKNPILKKVPNEASTSFVDLP